MVDRREVNCDPKANTEVARTGLEVLPLVADEARGSSCTVTIAGSVFNLDAIEENSKEHNLETCTNT